jgi:transcriptional regulatory protein LevR
MAKYTIIETKPVSDEIYADITAHSEGKVELNQSDLVTVVIEVEGIEQHIPVIGVESVLLDSGKNLLQQLADEAVSRQTNENNNIGEDAGGVEETRGVGEETPS